MSKPLVFMMGRSPAILPTDRNYTRNHMWAEPLGNAYRFGFSAYAVRLLGDIHHLEWSAEVDQTIAAGRPIGFIEGSKATSDLYAPVAGRVVAINNDPLEKPSLVNTNLYDSGWLLAIDAVDRELLTPEAYLAHVEAAWPLAQRLLKGQAGENHA